MYVGGSDWRKDRGAGLPSGFKRLPLTLRPPSLPPSLPLSDWTLEYDRKTGHFYHFNSRTGESEWAEEEEEEEGIEEEEVDDSGAGHRRTEEKGKERSGREKKEVVGPERTYLLAFTGKCMQMKGGREKGREGKRKEVREK